MDNMQEEDLKDTRAQNNTAEEVADDASKENSCDCEGINEAEESTKDQNPEASVSEIDPRDAKIEELQGRLLRLQADFDNFRRRTLVEKEQLGSFVTAGVVSKFLKVLDNFERAEQSAANSQNLEAIFTGMEKIRRQFEQSFKELNVVEIEALNQKFDPNLHEAVLKGQNPELADETIDLVLEKGYKIGSKVIRHSKVRVISND